MNKSIAALNYDRGLWDKQMLKNLVGKGKITKDEYIEITDALPDEISPEMDLAEAKEAKKRELSYYRDKAIDSGLDWNGTHIATDSESRGFITGAAVQAQIAPDYTCKWKAGDGFITLTSAMILAVAQAVRAHVQAQFDKQAALWQTVDQAATIDAVKAVSWS
jgi:hypothetical protein